jgi:O-antigen/teichoic acid export membrane protein
LINNKKNGILTDAFWYTIGAIIPMTVLLIRSPIYTRIFSPADYGYYSLVNITFTSLSSLSFAWIANCAWRYYLQYKSSDKINAYYRILTSLFTFSSILLILISGVWLLFAENYLLKRLIIFGYLYFATNELINLALVPMRIDGKSVSYNILHSSRAIISFGLLLGLTFISHIGIDAFFLAGALINIVYLAYILFNKVFCFNIGLKELSKYDIKQFMSYGTASIGINICLYFLITSDRYILALYRDIGEVGVYNQIYNIAQISLIAVINVYQAAINPKVFEKLESTDSDTNALLSSFAYKAFFLFLPMALVLSTFAKPISYILLGPGFRDAYYLLPFIVFGVLLNGMNYYETSKFKFRNRIKIILLGAVIATTLNIGLNFIFIPIYGMLAAAINTLIAYFFLWFFYYYNSDIRYLTDSRYKKKYLLLILLTVAIGLIYYVGSKFKLFKDLSIVQYILLGVFLALVYFVLTLKLNPFLSKIKQKFKKRS